jgi:hypothetical protein
MVHCGFGQREVLNRQREFRMTRNNTYDNAPV